MICGLGIDVTEVDRMARLLQRFGLRFAQKILTPEEVRLLPVSLGAPTAPATLAARFAAKEAAAKALGTGFSEGITLQNMEIHRLPSGQPCLHLRGAAAQRMAALGATRAHLSLTHGRDVAAAVVVLES